MLPLLRKKLKTISASNKPLQNIFKSCIEGEEVISVEKHTNGIHNTKVTLLLKNGEERVQFYNRLDLSEIMGGVTIEASNLAQVIDELNLKGFDFNEDDLEIIDNSITAKIASLGYIGQYRLTQVTPPIKGGWGFNYGSNFGATIA